MAEDRTLRLLDRERRAISEALKIRFYPIAIERARGSVVHDVSGREFIDFTAGWAVANVGYSHPKIVDAITAQVQKTTFASTPTFPTEVCVDYAERLKAMTPGDFSKKVWFGVGGSDAGDLIFKLLPAATKRPQILSFIGSFHGQTVGALSLSGLKAHSKHGRFGNVVMVPYAYCYRCPFGLTYPGCSVYCAREYIQDYIIETLAEPCDISGLVLEPIQSDGGGHCPAG